MARNYGKLIDGVKINELLLFKDPRGTVARMMRNDDPFFKQFGEIYFSVVESGAVKAWHLHKSMTLNYACIYGRIKLAIYDPRPHSPTFGMINTLPLEGYPSFEHYNLVTIPPEVWNGFRSLDLITDGSAIVANCATEPHDPDEIVRKAPDELAIEYDWGAYKVAG